MKILLHLEEFNNVSIIIRLIMATMFGALVGLERGSHGKSAGIRTFSLVCLGSAIVMITNEFLLRFYGNADVSRMGASVVSGVGFLGVGTIIVTGRNYVKGLTTAASLWATSGLGLVVGAGYIIAAVTMLILLFFIMTVLSGISRHTDSLVPIVHLYLEVSKDKGIETLKQYATDNDYKITSMSRQQKLSLHDEDIPILLEMNTRKRKKHEEIIDSLSLLEDIHYIEEVH